MTTLEKKIEAVRVANLIIKQLTDTTDVNVLRSWGVRGHGAGYVRGRDGIEMPCLILDVSGLIHTGRVVVALNEGDDVYEVALYDVRGNRVGDWIGDVTCDMLGSLLDSLIERSKGMTDEDYKDLSEFDSFIKCLLDF